MRTGLSRLLPLRPDLGRPGPALPGVRGGGLGPPPSPPFEAGAAAEVRKMDGPNSRFPTQPPGGSETRLKTPVCEPGGKQEADPTSHWPRRPHGCAHPTLTPAQASGPRGPGGQWKSMRVSGRRGPKATAGSVWHQQCHRGHVRGVGRQGRQGGGTGKAPEEKGRRLPDPCLTVCPEAAARGRPGRC